MREVRIKRIVSKGAGDCKHLKEIVVEAKEDSNEIIHPPRRTCKICLFDSVTFVEYEYRRIQRMTKVKVKKEMPFVRVGDEILRRSSSAISMGFYDIGRCRYGDSDVEEMIRDGWVEMIEG